MPLTDSQNIDYGVIKRALPILNSEVLVTIRMNLIKKQHGCLMQHIIVITFTIFNSMIFNIYVGLISIKAVMALGHVVEGKIINQIHAKNDRFSINLGIDVV